MDRTQGQAEAAERSSGPARVVTLTAGDFALTVNPVDGSEIEPLRPGTEPGRPAKRGPAARAARDAAARPPVLPGSGAPARLLPAREEQRERLVRLLSHGRSVRLTGPAGSGRSVLLDAVAADCAGIAPDGVVRLSGYGQQQPAELLQALYAAMYEAPDERPVRPDREELLARVREIGAVVLLDDLEMGGSALDELLRATPECAYLLAATPDTKAPSDDSHLEEVFLGGLGRTEAVEFLEAGVGRALTEEETAWAGDLRFASEGLALRFVQAAALLRQRDELNRSSADDDDEEPGVFEERPRDDANVALPTLAEGAAPAELLASRVSESARAVLRIACALGGELPHHTHLPALVGDTHADVAVAELLGCGLLSPVGARYRLAAGVARQLEEVGYGGPAAEEARTAARHYAWWTGHASVTPERVAAEADAVLAALAGADVVAAVLLARTAAPAFAASLHWEAWERVLRSGAEAARKAGEVAEQAYFHHELGVLALCEGRLDRARAELEASIGLRGALADKRGTVAGRRALALVTDREAAEVAVSPPLKLAPPVAPPVAPRAAGAVAGPVASPAAAPGAAGVAARGVAPVAPVAPAAPAARKPSEAVTAVVPVIKRPDAPPVPATLSEMFEDAFPLTPKPSPAPLLAPPVAEPDSGSRKRTMLLAAAGALTVVALGTVVALAMGSGEAEPSSGPGPASSTTMPDAPGAQGTGGNDSAEPGTDPGTGTGTDTGTAAEPGAAGPGTSAPPQGPAAPAPGVSPSPGAKPSGGGTPSRKPPSTPPRTPPVSTPPATSKSPETSPSPSELPSTPTPTASTSPPAAPTGP
ncbi:ATP-binding protein [Streptomyces sp. APSN-46.1]|uniref:ATP-binding protein n=1 Tax=Streptomyces sp. APSN-46.1 TaxID=2929049 RepID=UPI001FB563BD|nr:ATP-binding protein [Streptomyces sp. APSN-46.1]MCJ1680809.1 ATP-binding protein [Streptomyces sp. APSN-46.1]